MYGANFSQNGNLLNTPFPNAIPNGLPSMGSSQGILYVNGLESAKAYPTQPSQTVLLMDNNEDVFYIVESDASNFKTIKEYEFHEREQKNTSYVTHEEFDELKTLLEDYKPLLESLKE